MYMLLKHFHLTFVDLALLSLVLRGIWMMLNSPVLNTKLMRIAPHAINTLLLLSGIALSVHLQLSPGSQPWLLAKIIALVVYIGLGVAAFKVPNPLARKILWVDALILFAYIVSVAITKSPMGFFGS